MMIVANSEQAFMRKPNGNVTRINSWMDESNLQHVPEKTGAVIVKGRRRKNHVCLQIDNTIVTSKRHIKYFGFVMDQRLFFGEHGKLVSL